MNDTSKPQDPVYIATGGAFTTATRQAAQRAAQGLPPDASSDAREITTERWREMEYLHEIPVEDRPNWSLAPLEMNFAEASRWARQIRAYRVIQISTGETLVRKRTPKPAAWGL